MIDPDIQHKYSIGDRFLINCTHEALRFNGKTGTIEEIDDDESWCYKVAVESPSESVPYPFEEGELRPLSYYQHPRFITKQ